MTPSFLRSVLAGCVAGFIAISSVHAYEKVDKKIDKLLAGDHRDPANAVRDEFRHPKDTLMFFGIQPSMTVVEVWPSSGWWTEILAPLLKDYGMYYAAYIVSDAPGMPQFLRDREKAFELNEFLKRAIEVSK